MVYLRRLDADDANLHECDVASSEDHADNCEYPLYYLEIAQHRMYLCDGALQMLAEMLAIKAEAKK